MTYDQFFDGLKDAIKDYEWTVSVTGVIRGNRMVGKRLVSLPPTVVYYEKFHDTGICEIQREIACAEDNKEGHNSEIRKRLLDVLNL